MVDYSETSIPSLAPGAGWGSGPIADDSFLLALEDELDALLATDGMAVLVAVVVIVRLARAEAVARSTARSPASMTSNSSTACAVAGSTTDLPFSLFSYPYLRKGTGDIKRYGQDVSSMRGISIDARDDVCKNEDWH
jgi:hypothetical protein